MIIICWALKTTNHRTVGTAEQSRVEQSVASFTIAVATAAVNRYDVQNNIAAFSVLNFQFQQASAVTSNTHFMKKSPIKYGINHRFFDWFCPNYVHHNQKFTTLCAHTLINHDHQTIDTKIITICKYQVMYRGASHPFLYILWSVHECADFSWSIIAKSISGAHFWFVQIVWDFKLMLIAKKTLTEFFLDLRKFIKSILSQSMFFVIEFDDRTTLYLKLVVKSFW